MNDRPRSSTSLAGCAHANLYQKCVNCNRYPNGGGNSLVPLDQLTAMRLQPSPLQPLPLQLLPLPLQPLLRIQTGVGRSPADGSPRQASAALRSEPDAGQSPALDLRADGGGGVGEDGRTSEKTRFERLRPIGVFWDIENCNLSRTKSFFAFAEKIRAQFITGRYREFEFVCVCDTSSLERNSVEELNLAQLNLVHVNAGSKNAADDKLKQLMLRFVEMCDQPAAILLISCDINFISVISDIKHRKGAQIIILCRGQVSPALLATAHESYDFTAFTQDIDLTTGYSRPTECRLLVSNLPVDRQPLAVRHLLNKQVENCGGKIVLIGEDRAIIRFSSTDSAQRAFGRLCNYRFYGRPAYVQFIDPVDGQPTQAQPTLLHQPLRPPPLLPAPISPQPPQAHPVTNSHLLNNLPVQLKNFLPLLKAGQSAREQLGKDATTTATDTTTDTTTATASSASDGSSSGSDLGEPTGLKMKTSSSYPLQSNAVSGSFRYLPPTSILAAHKRNVPHIPLSRLAALPLVGREQSYLDKPSQHALARAETKAMPPPLDSTARAQSTTAGGPVELLITNLDSQLEPQAVKQALVELLQMHRIQFQQVTILSTQQLPPHLSHYATFFKHLPHCYLKAIVKVRSHQDAQLAVSQLHRTTLANKRILISYLSGDRLPPTHLIRAEIVAIFDEIPSKRLPLVAFQELYEKRYHRTLPMSEVYKLKDVIQLCTGTSQPGGQADQGKYVQLSPEFRSRCGSSAGSLNSSHGSSIVSSSSIDLCNGAALAQRCQLHPLPASGDTGWAEKESCLSLPSVCISLKLLGSRLHTLLQLHGGCMPLSNLLHCYQAEFNDPFDEQSASCVPLEHLLSCVPGVQLLYCQLLGYKRLQWAEKEAPFGCVDSQSSGGADSSRSFGEADCRNSRLEHNGRPASRQVNGSRGGTSMGGGSRPASACSNVNDSIAKQTSQFCREARDLLKNQPCSLIAFARFVPAYHNHFGRQCCVYSYGYTKLIDLLESVPHVLQVLGDGSRRTITLTHREQTKRFVSDLLRVLKAQPGKRLLLSELASLHERTFERKFRIQDYGVCFIEDMLRDVWSGTLVITPVQTDDGEHTEEDRLIEMPKREQTAEERLRTRTFAAEVIELLRSTPTLSMTFSKFIPFYHHYFNRQCKVSEFGFGKLIELLEALESECIELVENSLADEKLIRLNLAERRAALYARFQQIIKDSLQPSLTADQLEQRFRSQFGLQLNYLEYGSDGLCEFLAQMPSLFEVQPAAGGQQHIGNVDERLRQALRQRVILILLESPDGAVQLSELATLYQAQWQTQFSEALLDEPLLGRLIERAGTEIRLRPVCRFIRDCVLILQATDQQVLSVKRLEDEHQAWRGWLPKPADYGYKNWVQLFGAHGELLIVNKREDQGRIKWMLTVNKTLICRPLQLRSKPPAASAVKPANQTDLDQPTPCVPVMTAPAKVPLPPCEWLGRLGLVDQWTLPDSTTSHTPLDRSAEPTSSVTEQSDACPEKPLPTKTRKTKSCRIAANFTMLKS